MPSAIAKWRTQMSIALLVILASSAGSASASQIVAWGNPDNLQTNIPADLTNAVAIGAGSAYGIALLQSGTVRSWGNDYGGAGPVPAGLSNVTAIAAGLHHTLALKSDGTVTAWKYFFDEYGQANVPNGLSNVIGIAAGAYHSLALRANGTVQAWGNNSSGQTNIPAGLSNVVSIAAGGAHNLALKGDGTVAYWGELAAGNSALVASLSNVVAVSCGMTHAAVLFGDGTVLNWSVATLSPLLMPAGLTNVGAISCGGYHTLALRGDGTVLAWGYNAYGQTNVPSGLTNVVAVAGGDSFSAALSGDGSVNFVQQPAGITVVAGETGTFYAAASGAPKISWQWLKAGQAIPGETNSYLQLTNVTPSQANTYSVIASNSFGSTQSVAAVLSVLPLTITQQPVGLNKYGGDSASFQVQARNIGPFYYQWNLNGAPILNATNQSLYLPILTTNDAGAYSVVVSNQFGAVTSSNAALTVVPIAIAVQPTNVTVFSGEQANFYVLPWNNGPFVSQWRFNGGDIPGATNFSLIITNAGTNYAGNYTVVISNPYGVVESSNAVLSVVQSVPIITAQPTNDFAWYFGPASLRVTATGSKPLSYQWRFNNQDISGATNATLGMSRVTTNQAGLYSVNISNSFGTMPSSNAFLTVVPVTIWGAGLPARPASSLTNAVGITAGGVHALALLSDGTLAFWGVTECQPSLPAGISNVMGFSAGSLGDVLVLSNGMIKNWGCGVNSTSAPPGLSNVVAVEAGGFPTFLGLRSDSTVVSWGTTMVISNTLLRSVVAIAAGEQFNLALKAGGTVVAWGNNLFGQTNVPQNLSNVVAIACGDYHSLALRADGTVASWGASAPTNYYPPVNYGQTNVPAGLTNVVAICAGDTFSTALKADGTVVSWGRTNTGQTTPPPGLSNLWAVANQNNYSIGLVSFRPITIARQPANVVIGKGERALLSVGVVSTAPVSYRWQRGGQDMPSETNAVLVIPAATSDDQGTYHVVVSNQFASAVSRDVTVNVASIPTILLPPANQVVLRPGPATFSVTATSVFPMFYQWRHLSNIPGATGTSLTLTNVDRFYSGYYSVTVSNFIGSTNVEARLRVISPTALSSATVTNGSLTFTAKDSQGINLTAADVPFFTVWASTNLVDWQPVPNVITVNNNGTLTIMDPEAGNYPHRYYRLGEALTTRIPTAQRLSGPYGQSDGSVVLFSADSASVRLNAGDLPAIKFQASSNLADWFVLTNSIVVSNGVLILRDPTAKDNPQRFYRVEEQR